MDTHWPNPIDSAQGSVDSSWLLAYTDHVVDYACKLWAVEMKLPKASAANCDPIIDDSTGKEVRHLVRCFAVATRNQYRLTWSHDSYDSFVGGQDGHNDTFENSMLEHYHPLDNVLETTPATVVDKYGVVVLYYIPGALLPSRQAEIFSGASELNFTFEKNKPATGSTWRLNSRYYRQDEDGLMLAPGLATFGVLQSQGHQVPGKPIHITSDLGSSAKSATRAQQCARKWMRDNVVFGALMSAALAIAHPEQYALARQCLIQLAARQANMQELLKDWPFAFTSVAAISNRATGKHRDRRSGGRHLYDVMATIGGDRDVLIQFKGLGFTARYDSGSMVVTPCYTHLHSVSESPHAERIAFAAFMKPSVVLASGLDLPRPPSLKRVNALHARQ